MRPETHDEIKEMHELDAELNHNKHHDADDNVKIEKLSIAEERKRKNEMAEK